MTIATELAPQKKPATIRELLEGDSFKNQVAKALPRHLTPDRFIRIAVTAMTKTPLLAQCEQASFFNALLTLSQLGIEPDGRRAHLIPFKNNNKGTVECQLIVDYKGLVELVINTGQVSRIHADIVCDNDIFEYDRGQITKHQINFRKPRGSAYAVYAIIAFKDGTEKAEVMTIEEVEAVRKRSRAAQNGPWVTDFNEMAKKTVFRRASKWVKLSPEQRDIIEADDEQFQLEVSAGKGASAAALADRLAVADEKPQDLPEHKCDDEGGTASISRIDSLIDMIRAAQNVKELDTAWQQCSDSSLELTANEVEILTNERKWRKAELAKGKK